MSDGKYCCLLSAWLCAAVLLASCAFGSVRASSCDEVEAAVERADDSARVSHQYQGLWVSQRCEVRPGPHFVLRRYLISRGGRFRLALFHYLDPWCRRAAYWVGARGRLGLPGAPSWVVPGAQEPQLELKAVHAVAYGGEGARMLNATCPGADRWRPHRKYRVLGVPEAEDDHKRRKHRPSMDCSISPEFAFTELQLIRLELRSPPGLRLHHPVLHLYLGAQSAEAHHRPTHYQVALVPPQTPVCPVCLALSRSTPTSPPQLSPSQQPRTETSPSLDGHWTSLRCEVRPHGLFLRRRLSFDAGHWRARHVYYRDPRCRRSAFELSAGGPAHRGRPSYQGGAVEYDFEVARATLAPLGALKLGVAVPSLERDLVRVERDGPERLMFLGETSAGTRATGFQPPLVQCTVDVQRTSNEIHPLPLVSSGAVAAVLRVCCAWLCLVVGTFRSG